MSNDIIQPADLSAVAGLLNINIWMVAKWFVVVGLLMYVVYAIVIVKQTSIMVEAVESHANSLVRLFAWAHLLGAVLLVALAIMLL